MARRRMFSLDVVDTDKFLDMPSSAQALYFHLGMRADDEGFVSSPKRITKTVNCDEDDFDLLIAKGYLIPFESGVVVVSDWEINNWIRPDRKQSTRYKYEKSLLDINNHVYTLSTKCQPSDNQVTTECHTQDSLGKDSLGKDSIVKSSQEKNGCDLHNYFVKPSISEIVDYIQKNNLNVDAKRFWNHYESTGWKTGKDPIHDWKGLLKKWSKAEREEDNPGIKAIQLDEKFYAKPVQMSEEQLQSELAQLQEKIKNGEL